MGELEDFGAWMGLTRKLGEPVEAFEDRVFLTLLVEQRGRQPAFVEFCRLRFPRELVDPEAAWA